jgi:methionyl-tRNA formyltransferase
MALRVVFFGTPAFAVPTLEHLLRSPHQVVGVVTQPDRPRGRGQRISEGPVKSVAVAAGVPVLQPERLARDVVEASLAALGADIGVVAAYGKILPDWLLALPRLGLINVHASLLPRYRGASPIHRAVMAGETQTGVTIMRVVTALDAGPILSMVTVPIGADDTTPMVEAVLAERGAALLVTTLDAIEMGRATEMPQDDSQATYAPKILKTDGIIDWHHPADRVHNLVRGLWPWPHAYSWVNGVRHILHRSQVSSLRSSEPPGTIVRATAADGLQIACGSETTLDVIEVQLEGKRVMRARDLLAAEPLRPGARFGTP